MKRSLFTFAKSTNQIEFRDFIRKLKNEYIREEFKDEKPWIILDNAVRKVAIANQTLLYRGPTKPN